MATFNLIYLGVALLISLFYGFFAVRIFWGTEYSKTLPLIKRIREIIFNFLGASMGFLVLYYLIRKALFSILEKQYNLVTISDVLLLLIAIIGIFGLLPWTTHTISSKIDKILSPRQKE